MLFAVRWKPTRQGSPVSPGPRRADRMSRLVASREGGHEHHRRHCGRSSAMNTERQKLADDVQVENRRLDTSENDALIEMARMGADAFGYTADLRIDRQLAQLLRLRVSQLNNCTYCLNLHYQAARAAGIPRAKIGTLTAWWETELYSEAERAALRYAEALTRAADTDRDAAFQRFHDALAENFSPEQMLEIVGVVNMNVWTRIKLAEGAMPGPV